MGCPFLSFFLFFWGFSSVFWSLGIGILSIGFLEFGVFLWSVFSWEAELFFQGVNIRLTLADFCVFFSISRLPNTHFNFPSFFPGQPFLGHCMVVSTSEERSLRCRGQRRSLSGFLCHDGFHEHHHIDIRVLDLHHPDWLLDETPGASWFTRK